MGTVSFKKNIKMYYNQEAALRDSKSIKSDWKIRVRAEFYNIIKRENKKTLLELGAGAGYDSQFFMNNGLSVIAIDIAGEMIKMCREKSIESFELDFYNLSSLNKKFDCIYAINTLLHVPKVDLSYVLNEINSTLEKDGLFYMGVYGGDDTENEFKNDVSDSPRNFTFYSENYLKKILGNIFNIINFVSFDIGTGTDIFHSITMRKKQSSL